MLLAFVAGCSQAPSESPGGLQQASPREGWIPLGQSADLPTNICLDAAGSCVPNDDPFVLAAILANMTLHQVDLDVALASGNDGEASWSLECQGTGCAAPLAEGRDSFPFSIRVEGLQVTGSYLVLRLEVMSTLDQQPPVVVPGAVEFEGRARVQWGAPLVEVVREYPLTLNSLYCYPGLPCDLGRGEVTPSGAVVGFELEAHWDAATPIDDLLSFAIFCRPNCLVEFDSAPTPSPARFAGELHLLGPFIVHAGVDHELPFGQVNGGPGTGTEVHAVLRTTELVAATP